MIDLICLLFQAIKWAATQWDVDIISLSLGLNDDHEEIELELESVLNPGGRDGAEADCDCCVGELGREP